jgi:hypothetical protein
LDNREFFRVNREFQCSGALPRRSPDVVDKVLQAEASPSSSDAHSYMTTRCPQVRHDHRDQPNAGRMSGQAPATNSRNLDI